MSNSTKNKTIRTWYVFKTHAFVTYSIINITYFWLIIDWLIGNTDVKSRHFTGLSDNRLVRIDTNTS